LGKNSAAGWRDYLAAAEFLLFPFPTALSSKSANAQNSQRKPAQHVQPAAQKKKYEFPLEVIQAAVASMNKWHVPASITLAQWALESGFGKHMPSGSNNPFGMKARKGDDFVEAKTKEAIGDEEITVTAKFRKFVSIAEAFDEHAKLLATSKAYAKAMKAANDPDKFADALTGVYATDPHYGQKLKDKMKTYELYRYDKPDKPLTILDYLKLVLQETACTLEVR
jgi:flagellum-specific peptidoglycan hydrolase FlgJ